MSLLEVITKALVENESGYTPSEYPIVLDPDFILHTLKPKRDDPSPASAAISLEGWETLPKKSLNLIELGKEFSSELKEKLKNPVEFRKAEFLEMLRSFLEKIRMQVGVEIGIEILSADYFRVLVEAVVDYLGRDVTDLVLYACVVLKDWELVKVLIASGFVSNDCYKSLMPVVVAKSMSKLLCQCVMFASDLGLSELVLILKYFLSVPKDAHASNLEVRREWESQALLAMERAGDRTLSGKRLSMAKDAAILLMVAYDGFSSAELCLHYLLASKNVDEVILSSAIGQLSKKEMLSLLRYLGKWLKKYERFPQAGSCHKVSVALGLGACDWVPKLEDVVKFIGVVLDESYSALVLHPEFHEELRSINELVGSLASEARLCCSVAIVANKLKAEYYGSLDDLTAEY